jgi:hypothetical protein
MSFSPLKGLSSTDPPLKELEKDHFKIDHSDRCNVYGEMVGYFRQGE